MRLWAVVAWAALGETLSVPEALAQLHEEGEAFEAFVKKRRAKHARHVKHVKHVSKAEAARKKDLAERKAVIFTKLVEDHEREKRLAAERVDDPVYETPEHETKRIDDEWAPFGEQIEAEAKEEEREKENAAMVKERDEEAARHEREDVMREEAEAAAGDPSGPYGIGGGVPVNGENVGPSHHDDQSAKDAEDNVRALQLAAEETKTDKEIKELDESIADSDPDEAWREKQEEIHDRFEERERKRAAAVERRLNPDEDTGGDKPGDHRILGENIDAADYDKIAKLTPHQRQALRRALDTAGT